MGDSQDSFVWISVFTDGVVLLKQHRFSVRTGIIKSETHFEEDAYGISFGKSGMSDLTNNKYCKILQEILLSHLKNELDKYYTVESTTFVGSFEKPTFEYGRNCIRINIKDEIKQSW